MPKDEPIEKTTEKLLKKKLSKDTYKLIQEKVFDEIKMDDIWGAGAWGG